MRGGGPPGRMLGRLPAKAPLRFSPKSKCDFEHLAPSLAWPPFDANRLHFRSRNTRAERRRHRGGSSPAGGAPDSSENHRSKLAGTRCRTRRTHMRKPRAFTLVELLVVIGII